MPIKVRPEGDLYVAEVTPPDGQWKSAHPMFMGDLEKALEDVGCDSEAVNHAIFLAFYDRYRPYAEEVLPQVRAALSGSMKVRQQSAWVEAWITYSLISSKESKERRLTIQDILCAADSLNKAMASPDEISWTFIQLKRRGWLVDEDGVYALTPEARLLVEQIVEEERNSLDGIDRLEAWISANPPGSDGQVTDTPHKN